MVSAGISLRRSRGPATQQIRQPCNGRFHTDVIHHAWGGRTRAHEYRLQTVAVATTTTTTTLTTQTIDAALHSRREDGRCLITLFLGSDVADGVIATNVPVERRTPFGGKY